MAYHVLSTARPAAFSNPFSGALNAVVTWNNARLTRNALSKLSDMELNDIGLNRFDIDVVAERTARW